MTHKLVAPMLACVVVLPLAACADGTQSTPQSRAPAAEVIGEPVNCINTASIRNTRVHDDTTIDFVMAGRQTFRNTLRHRCPGLGFSQRFAYRSTVGRLCSNDTITVLQSGSNNPRGASCQLGRFVPIQLVTANSSTASSSEESDPPEPAAD